jgi:predicted RNA binding protein YcfA (HicA-like mRNA interferase family)
MNRLPRFTGKELVDLLGKAGFEIIRIRGSHYILGHSDGRRTVVPVHSGETIGPGLLTQILRDCELTRDQIRSLL